MATQADIRDFIAMVTGGFMPLRDLIVKGQEMGLNVQDTVEIVANLQPNLVPSNIMASMNAPAMVDNPYTAPRIGFEEATQLFDVPTLQAPLQTDLGPEFGFQAVPQMNPPTDDVDTDEMMPNPITYTYDLPKIGQSSSGLPGNTNMKATNQTGVGSMSMSDIINNNIQASQAEVGNMTQPSLDQPVIENQNSRPPRVIDIEPQVRKQPTPRPPTPVNFSYGDTQTGMMDAAATLRSPFTSNMDRQAAQDYMSGIVSNIRLPF